MAASFYAHGTERYMLLTQHVPARRVGGKSPLLDFVRFLVLLQGRTVFADQAGNHPGGTQAEQDVVQRAEHVHRALDAPKQFVDFGNVVVNEKTRVGA